MIKKLYSPITRRRFLAASAAGTGAMSLAGSPWRFARAAGTVQLRLLETTDVHVHVFPYDYYRDREDDTVGLAKTASIIDALRAEAPNTLLVDNGDFLQGNPMGDYMAYRKGLAEGDVHPIVKAMNAVGFDVATIGNHEFNYGLDFLMTALAGAEFPVVLANVHKGTARASVAQDDFLVEPWTLLERAVIDGEGQEHAIRHRRDRLHAAADHDLGPGASGGQRRRARHRADRRRRWCRRSARAGADVVIALSHSGISTEAASDEMENASFYLSQVPGIDAILTGHHHRVFPGPDYADLPGIDAERGLLGGVPAVMGGFWGSHLGVIDLLLEHDGGDWRVVDAVSEARPIYGRQEREVIPLVEASPAVLAAVAGRARGDARLRPRAGRRDLGADQQLFRPGPGRPPPRSRSSPTPSAGTSSG